MTIQRTLNPQQDAAVRHTGGPMRIIAGAGTGKTQTLTERFAHLAGSGIREDRILCLTFSRRAVRELEARILTQFPHGYRKLWIRTFHSFCLSLVQEWRLLEHAPPVTVLQGRELRAFVSEVVTAIPDDALHAHHGEFGREKLVDTLLTFRSQARDLLMSPEEIDRYVAAAEPVPGRLRDLATAHRSVSEAQEQSGFHDYSSMGYEVVRALESDPHLLARTQLRFDHILVDEFQDTNLGQFRLIQLLAPHDGTVCVVGDGNQAIYAFRGGLSHYIQEFEQYFPGTSTYVLGTNYRSGQTILDAANALIRHNPGGDWVTLRAVEPASPGVITITPAANPSLEAAHIVHSILELTRRQHNPVSYADIAILLRSTDRNATSITRAFAAHGIPFRSGDDQGGDVEVIRNVLAALRLIAGSQRWPDAARLVARSNRESAWTLRGLERRGSSADHLDSLLEPGNEGHYDYSITQKEAIRDCRRIAAQCRQYAQLPLADALYKAMVLVEALHEGTDQATANTMRSFLDQATGLSDAAGNLNDLAAMLSAGYGDAPWHQSESSDGVTILTVHSAKGLEWPVVFLPAMTDGEFPLPMKLDFDFDAETMRDWSVRAGNPPSESERRLRFLQEERRLAYVAITRTRQELHISYPVRGSAGGKLRPSQFIADAGLIAPDAAAASFELGMPPASMSDLARQLRTRRNQALYTAIDDPALSSRLAGLLLEQSAALRGIAGATPIRARSMPEPNTAGDALRLSYSQVDLYQDCPRKYFYARTLKLEDIDEPASFRFGTIVHDILNNLNEQWRETGQVPEIADIERAIDAVWPASAFQFETQNRQLRQRARAMLARYFDWERSRPIPRRPVTVESSFRVGWDRHQFSGRIDAILEGEDGSVEIIDFKTSKRDSSSLRKPDESLQLFIYDHAHRNEYPERTPRVSYLALRHDDDRAFVTGEAWDERQTRSHVHTDESRHARCGVIDGTIARMMANDFEPTPSPTVCNGCAYRWICPAEEGD